MNCLGELITYERPNDKTPTKIVRHISFDGSDSETEESEAGKKNPVRFHTNGDTKKEPGYYPGWAPKQEYVCQNEGHEKKPIFETEQDLNRHIFAAHKCPACVFSCMFNSELVKHFKIHNDRTIQQRCDLCKVYVTDIRTHMKISHPKCCSCEKSFLDLQALKIHEPFCDQVKIDEVSKKRRMIYLNPHRRAFKSMALS